MDYVLCTLDVTVVFVQNEYSVLEQAPTVTVCVVLSGAIERRVTAELNSSPLTASDGAGIRQIVILVYVDTYSTDYATLAQTIIFTSNDPVCEEVTIIDDSTLEEIELFQISLSSSDPDVSLGEVFVATISILNDDSKSSNNLSVVVLTQLISCVNITGDGILYIDRGPDTKASVCCSP